MRPKRQDPLRPFPPGSYDDVLPWELPTTRDYLRGDGWCVVVPGLPPVPGGPSGGSSEWPDRLITGLDYKYDRKTWWPAMLRAHAERAYTHWYRWAPNALYDDPQYGGDPSIARFVDDCGRIKRAIPYVGVNLASKVFDARDMSVQQYLDRVGPLLAALLEAGVVDEVIPGMEWDLWNVPGETTIEIAKWVGQSAHAYGASCWLHFSPHVTGWWTLDADGTDRGRYGFWDDLGEDVDGLNYQSDPSWDVPELQARIVDTLSQFGKQGNRHKFRLFEDQAAWQFSGHPMNDPRPDELDGCQRGYLACCTIDNVAHTDAKVWGFGNGGRYQDGWPM